MLALIDSDTLCYASAAMAEGQSPQLACWNAEAGLESLLTRLNNPPFKLFVTGEGNFRYQIYPEYKANRLKMKRPEFLQDVKDHLIQRYDAVNAEGCEADDLLGVEQMANEAAGVESMIVSIDKDLDQISGWHYSPEITRRGVTVKAARRYLVSPFDGLRFFYQQLLTGDPTDNIKGVLGVGKKGAGKLLDGLDNEQALFDAVRSAYGCDEELELNAKVLWIWKKENDNIVDRWIEELSYHPDYIE